MNDNLNKFIRKHLLDLVPYESARNIMNESQSTDINLDANENPYGISCDYTTMNRSPEPQPQKLIIEYANSPVSAKSAPLSVLPAPIKVTAVPTTIDGVDGIYTNGTDANSEDPYFIFFSCGAKTVSVIVGDENGCSDTTRTVSVERSEEVIDLVSDLEMYFPFDGNGDDASGNNQHLVTTGSPEYVTGFFGQAVNFDGLGNDYFEKGINDFYKKMTPDVVLLNKGRASEFF